MSVKPDVPLIISLTKFAVNIILDLIFILKVHVNSITSTVNMQAGIQLACNMASAIAGLAYFFIYTTTIHKSSVVHHGATDTSTRPSLSALQTLSKPGAIFFTESAVRNTLYLWLVHGIVAMGSDYAIAWGVFSTIRWGLIMVPVMALEVTSLTFVGHSWGYHRKSLGDHVENLRASWRQLWTITRWTFYSICIALAVEIPLCLVMSFLGARPFARYLPGSDTVAVITARMWRTFHWCYIFYLCPHNSPPSSKIRVKYIIK